MAGVSRRERMIVLDQSNLDPQSAQHVTSRANPKFHEVNNIPLKVSDPKCFSYRSTHTLLYATSAPAKGKDKPSSGPASPSPGLQVICCRKPANSWNYE